MLHDELVCWEDEDRLSLSKPAGIPVFPPHRDPDGDCLLRRLLERRPAQAEKGWPPGFEGGIAHRLDTSTSGQVLVARTPEALLELRRLFEEKRLLKVYVLVTGKDVPWDENRITHRIAHDPRRKGRMVFERGKSTPHRGRWIPAETRFVRLGDCGGGLVAWQAEMRSGVMHQVRVHAAAAGIALAGDRPYGGGELAWERPEGVEFLLHHRGLSGPGLGPPEVAVPSWWPAVPGG